MNGLSGNRLSICLLRFRIPAKNFLLTSAVTRWIETLGGNDPESLRANRPAFTLDTIHYLFNIFQTT